MFTNACHDLEHDYPHTRSCRLPYNIIIEFMCAQECQGKQGLENMLGQSYVHLREGGLNDVMEKVRLVHKEGPEKLLV